MEEAVRPYISLDREKRREHSFHKLLKSFTLLESVFV